MAIKHCEHDNIEIAFKCMDCQEEAKLFPDAEQYMPMDEVDEEDKYYIHGDDEVEGPGDDYWPEKIDALEQL